MGSRTGSEPRRGRRQRQDHARDDEVWRPGGDERAKHAGAVGRQPEPHETSTRTDVRACRSPGKLLFILGRKTRVYTHEEGSEPILGRKTRLYTHVEGSEPMPRRRAARSRSRWREEDMEYRWMVPLRELRVEARDGQGEAWQVSGVWCACRRMCSRRPTTRRTRTTTRRSAAIW